MTDVANKKCSRNGYTKRASYGAAAGGRRRMYCAQHAKDDMTYLEKQGQISREERGGGERGRVGSTAGGSARRGGVGEKRRGGTPPPTRITTFSEEGSSAGGRVRGRSKRVRLVVDIWQKLRPLQKQEDNEEMSGQPEREYMRWGRMMLSRRSWTCRARLRSLRLKVRREFAHLIYDLLMLLTYSAKPVWPPSKNTSVGMVSPKDVKATHQSRASYRRQHLERLRVCIPAHT